MYLTEPVPVAVVDDLQPGAAIGLVPPDSGDLGTPAESGLGEKLGGVGIAQHKRRVGRRRPLRHEPHRVAGTRSAADD